VDATVLLLAINDDGRQAFFSRWMKTLIKAVENCFDDIKNQLDMKRLRTQSATAMDSRLFIQFLALILLSKLRSLSKQDDTIRNLTIREIMEHMEAVTEIRFSGRYGKVVAEADRLQRKIMDCFGVSVET
jgi:transposase